MIDNSALIRRFVPEVNDGDSFIYTEFIDRVRGYTFPTVFFHRSRGEFDNQLSEMRVLCEALRLRAYTRLSTKSFKKVGVLFTEMVVQRALSGEFGMMKRLYASALGRSSPVKKYWLFDVDNREESALEGELSASGKLVCVIPSRAGRHLITMPFDGRELQKRHPGVDLQRDNPTNLFIPDLAT